MEPKYLSEVIIHPLLIIWEGDWIPWGWMFGSTYRTSYELLLLYALLGMSIPSLDQKQDTWMWVNGESSKQIPVAIHISSLPTSRTRQFWGMPLMSACFLWTQKPTKIARSRIVGFIWWLGLRPQDGKPASYLNEVTTPLNVHIIWVSLTFKTLYL